MFQPTIRILTSLLFVLNCGIVIGQTKADEQYALGQNIADTNFKAAIPVFYEALEGFENQNELRKQISTIDNIGACLAQIGEVDSARAMYTRAINLAHEGTDSEFLLETYYNYIVNCFTDQGNYGDALRIGLEIKRNVDGSTNLREIYWSNRILERVYFYLPESTDEYLELARSSDSIANVLQDTLIIEQSLFALAVAYTRTSELEKAKATYKRLIDIQLANKNPTVYASVNNLAGRYADGQEWDSARYYYQQGEMYAMKFNRPVGIAASNMYQGRIEYEIENYAGAIPFVEKALQTFRDADILRRQNLCARLLYLCHKELRNHEEALYYLELENELVDSLKKRSKVDDARLIQQSFDHDMKVLSDSLNHSYQQELKDAELHEQETRSMYLYIGLGLSLLFGAFIFNRFRVTNKQKLIIEDQKSEIDSQHQQLKESHNEIQDSIVYAKRIQSAILPSNRLLKEKLPESFVLYMPKDVVAGDFYWIESFAKASDSNGSGIGALDGMDEVLIAAADCTGHGVPGAMVSVVCHNSLNRAVREFGLKEPAQILNKVRELVIETFAKSDKEIKDGMDIALISLRGNALTYAGAHNPLWIQRGDELIEIKADKQPIGKFDVASDFTSHQLQLQKDDLIYIFTDGYVDQFGGEKGKKFKSANFKKLIATIQNEPMESQKERLISAFNEWKGQLEQVDDVCVIGIRV